jgi:hypothetical protein
VSLDGAVLGELAGSEDGFVIDGAPSGRRCVQLAGFLAESEAAFWRGCPVESCCGCGAARRYIPALCDGSSVLTITVPIFGLNFLFTGGAAPPCRAACDCNGDARFDLSDAVCTLGFLFLGTAAPVGWIDGRPACVDADPAASCDVPHPACL